MICPVCHKYEAYCRCLNEGMTAKRRKALEVASEHLYLLRPDEMEHLVQIQKKHRVGYSDVQRSNLLAMLENSSVYEQTSFL